MIYSLNSGETQEANSKAISLYAYVPPYLPALDYIFKLSFIKYRKGSDALEDIIKEKQPYYKLIDFMRRSNIKHREVAEFLGKSSSAFCQNIKGTGADLYTLFRDIANLANCIKIYTISKNRKD